MQTTQLFCYPTLWRYGYTAHAKRAYVKRAYAKALARRLHLATRWQGFYRPWVVVRYRKVGS